MPNGNESQVPFAGSKVVSKWTMWLNRLLINQLQ
jgi:hypothetical protein